VYPTQLLVAMLLLTAGALAMQVRARARRRAALRDLAARTGTHYSPHDRFGLAPRVARHFPLPGVADVRVSDLLYRSDDRGHRYVFTADHTRGVLGIKRRARTIVLLTEPRHTPGRPAEPVIRAAEQDGPTVAQYESFLRDDPDTRA
jgi:hypothetical protein